MSGVGSGMVIERVRVGVRVRMRAQVHVLHVFTFMSCMIASLAC